MLSSDSVLDSMGPWGCGTLTTTAPRPRRQLLTIGTMSRESVDSVAQCGQFNSEQYLEAHNCLDILRHTSTIRPSCRYSIALSR